MRTIKIVIEKDDCSWRATSPDINGMFIFANSLNEVRELVKSGVPFYLDSHDVEIIEVLEPAV
jgi:predicted RNase H-like HicB family nuclease